MSVYKPVSQNISKENNSYRVRFTKNGRRYSKNFTSKKAAIEFRNKMVTTTR